LINWSEERFQEIVDKLGYSREKYHVVQADKDSYSNFAAGFLSSPSRREMGIMWSRNHQIVLGIKAGIRRVILARPS
jgi:hypothetical protein